jgi:hypothetical protein
VYDNREFSALAFEEVQGVAECTFAIETVGIWGSCWRLWNFSNLQTRRDTSMSICGALKTFK